MPGDHKKPNPMAKELQVNKLFKPKVVKPKKGRGSYTRKGRDGWNEGGSVAPAPAPNLVAGNAAGPAGIPAPTTSVVPGYAQNAINAYMAGHVPTVPGLSYGTGNAVAQQDLRIQNEQMRRELDAMGIDPTPFVQDHEVRFEGNFDEARQNNYNNMINNVGVWEGEMPKGFLGLNEKIQGKARATDGVTYNINGQPVTVDANGKVYGTLPPGMDPNMLTRKAIADGHIAKPDVPDFLSGIYDTVAGWTGMETVEQIRKARAAHEARLEAERKATAAARNAARAQLATPDHGRHSGGSQDRAVMSDADRRGGRNMAGGSSYSGSRGGFAGARNMGGPIYANMGQEVEEDVWGADPLAVSRPTAQLQQASHAPAGMPMQQQQGGGMMSQLASMAAGKAMENMMPGWGQAGSIIAGGLFNKGGEVMKNKMSAGTWVGKRCRYLNDGGLALPEAEMQAFNEMQAMTGQSPTMAADEVMLPDPNQLPMSYTQDDVNNFMSANDIQGGAMDPMVPRMDFGYIPSSGTTVKEQMEMDKMEIQRAKAMDKAEMDREAFDLAEQRKQQMHELAMKQKEESHAEAMKQKRAPLANKEG